MTNRIRITIEYDLDGADINDEIRDWKSAQTGLSDVLALRHEINAIVEFAVITGLVVQPSGDPPDGNRDVETFSRK